MKNSLILSTSLLLTSCQATFSVGPGTLQIKPDPYTLDKIQQIVKLRGKCNGKCKEMVDKKSGEVRDEREGTGLPDREAPKQD